MYSQTFIKSFKRFSYHRECPGNARSDNGKNFVSEETESFVHNLVVEWHVNLSLTLWHDSFFEYLVRSVKELLRKELKCYRLLYEEFQTVIFEIEYFVNNQLMTSGIGGRKSICVNLDRDASRIDYKSHYQLLKSMILLYIT